MDKLGADFYYTVDTIDPALDPYVGWLRAAQFLASGQQPAIDLGPALLVDTAVADGRLVACAAERAGTHLLGRPLDVDLDPQVEAWADAFVASGWSYKALVKSVVMSDAYRRIR
jgi:hypothetical protein